MAGKLHETWCSVVREYSGRDFTKTNGRPIALRGVAERLQHVYSSSDNGYVHGLWKLSQPQQFQCGMEDVQREMIKQTNAGPSGSWVSHVHSSKFLNSYLALDLSGNDLQLFLASTMCERRFPMSIRT